MPPTSEFPNTVPLPEVGTGQTGAAGQLFSAVMQAAGLYAQADVLETFSSFLRSAGVLIFVLAVVGGIVSLAVFGSVKRASWFLIGPLLFYVVLEVRVPVDPTAVQAAQRGAAVSPEMVFLQPLKGEKLKPAQVSWVFVQIDRVISQITQHLIGFFVDTKRQRDLVNLARERVLAEVLSAKVVNPELLRLVSFGVVGHCAELSRGYRDRALVTEKLRRNKVSQQKGENLFRQPGALEAERTDLEARIRDYERRQLNLDDRSWEYLQTLGIVRKEVVVCKDVWEFVRKGYLREAKIALDAKAKGAAEASIAKFPWAEVIIEVKKVVASGSPDKANEVIAAYLLQNTILGTPHDAITGGIFGRTAFHAIEYNDIFDVQAKAESLAGLAKITMFAGTIAYIHSVITFYAEMLFPFFALFLIVPHQAPTFFFWVRLWAWLKSWYVGFAALHPVREVLWQYLNRGIGNARAGFDWDDPSTVYQVMSYNDPLAHFGTYYNLIDVLTVSIPFITAHCFVGLSDIFTYLRPSIDKTSREFRDRIQGGWQRENATILDIQMERDNAEAGLRAVDNFLAKGGCGLTAAGIPRTLTGGAECSRKLDEIYRGAFFDNKQRQFWDRANSGHNTGRHMDYSHGQHLNAGGALLNRLLEGNPKYADWGFKYTTTPFGSRYGIIQPTRAMRNRSTSLALSRPPDVEGAAKGGE